MVTFGPLCAGLSATFIGIVLPHLVADLKRKCEHQLQLPQFCTSQTYPWLSGTGGG